MQQTRLILALQAIISQLRQDDDPIVQQEALTQLCELLSVSSEEALSMLPVESLVPILVCQPFANPLVFASLLWERHLSLNKQSKLVKVNTSCGDQLTAMH